MPINLEETFAQTNNESVRILITDAIEDLQNSDTNAALTHSNLALQELSSSANASSSLDSVRTLLNDAIRNLQEGDSSTALADLNLANKQLATSGVEPAEDITNTVKSADFSVYENSLLPYIIDMNVFDI